MEKREILMFLYFGNINLKEPNLFLFFNLFFVFVSFKVRSLRQFLYFSGTFSCKSERCKCKYIKYEQRSISLIFITCNTFPPKTKPSKNPEISRNSKRKTYLKASFLRYFRILPCLYIFLRVATRHFCLYWASKAGKIFWKETTNDLFGEITISFAYQYRNIGAIKCQSRSITCATKSLLEMRKIILSKIDHFNFGITPSKWEI